MLKKNFLEISPKEKNLGDEVPFDGSEPADGLRLNRGM
jgi:hypothetical protein